MSIREQMERAGVDRADVERFMADLDGTVGEGSKAVDPFAPEGESEPSPF